MPSPPPPAPRRRLPALLALLILLLALAVVAATHLYWQELRGQVDRLHAALAEARGQQQQALDRLHDAGARLAVAAAGPPAAEGAAPTAGTGRASGSALADPDLRQRLDRAAADVERLAAALADQRPTAPPRAPAADWPGVGERTSLQRELNALAREAMHLPPMRYLPPPGSPTPPLLLRGSDLRARLRQAEDAAALGDFALVAQQVLGARRFLGYYHQEPHALALARRLENLHARLQQPGADAEDQARLNQLAVELRSLVRQLPAAAPAAPPPR